MAQLRTKIKSQHANRTKQSKTTQIKRAIIKKESSVVAVAVQWPTAAAAVVVVVVVVVALALVVVVVIAYHYDTKSEMNNRMNKKNTLIFSDK